MDLDLGDTRLIIEIARARGVLRNQLAYLLATAYWETNRTMQPVEEAYWLSDAWRAKNLRYYPWHGRGYVQVTWERNYRRTKAETGVDVVAKPDLLLSNKEVSATALVVGCLEGWWTGKRLDDFITLKRSDYVGARRVVNGTDKAHAIAEIAREYEAALLAEGYGVEMPAPIVNTRRDGTEPRKNPAQSTTNLSVIGGGLATISQLSDQAKGVVGQLTEGFGVSPEFALVVITSAALAWIFRERLRKWAEGDR